MPPLAASLWALEEEEEEADDRESARSTVHLYQRLFFRFTLIRVSTKASQDFLWSHAVVAAAAGKSLRAETGTAREADGSTPRSFLVSSSRASCASVSSWYWAGEREARSRSGVLDGDGRSDTGLRLRPRRRRLWAGGGAADTVDDEDEDEDEDEAAAAAAAAEEETERDAARARLPAAPAGRRCAHIEQRRADSASPKVHRGQVQVSPRAASSSSLGGGAAASKAERRLRVAGDGGAVTVAPPRVRMAAENMFSRLYLGLTRATRVNVDERASSSEMIMATRVIHIGYMGRERWDLAGTRGTRRIAVSLFSVNRGGGHSVKCKESCAYSLFPAGAIHYRSLGKLGAGFERSE